MNKKPASTLYGIVLASALLTFGAVCSEDYFDKLLTLAEQRYGEKAKQTLSQWQTMLYASRDVDETVQLTKVNDFINQHVTFDSDLAIWATSDYWATPLETLGLGQGDCEDFSIAKYVSLLKLNIPLAKLRLVYVKANMGNGRSQAHMVLAYYKTPGAEPLILDNLSRDILPASRRHDLTPVFSFNSAGLWVGNDKKPKVQKPETRLSRWRDVITRMQVDGIQ